MRPIAARSFVARALVASAIAFVVTPAFAQPRAARPLTAPPVEFAEPFSSIARMVELANGTVLVNDTREKRLGVADFGKGTFNDVAREGAGPLEYRVVFALMRGPGDSVLLWDIGNQRRMVLSPDGRPVRTEATGAGDMMSMIGRPLPRDFDARGNLYSTHRGLDVKGPQMLQSDSVAIVRFAAGSQRGDTLAQYGASPNSRSTGSKDGVVQMPATGFPALDAWAVFPDGRVLLIRGADYVPEIIRPDRSRVRAAAIPHTRLPLTAADKEASMKQARAQAAGMRMPAPPGGAPPRFEAVEPAEWQATLPPLASTTIRVDSRARAWVHVRERDAAAGERYDLLDADGRLVDAIRLPKGLKLIAMGKGVLYGTREDEDGLIYLVRLPLP